MPGIEANSNGFNSPGRFAIITSLWDSQVDPHSFFPWWLLGVLKVKDFMPDELILGSMKAALTEPLGL